MYAIGIPTGLDCIRAVAGLWSLIHMPRGGWGSGTRRLARLRTLLSWGLTQSQIAAIMNTSQQAISYQVRKLRQRYYSRSR